VRQGSPTLGDVIRRFGAKLREQRSTAMTTAQTAVLTALGRCHTAALGGHLYRCDNNDCGAEHVAFNGCQSRHCPSCQGHKSAAWMQARAAELLPVPYFHVVFTVPEQVSALALGNKKTVYGILFCAAAKTLLTTARDPKHLGAAIGFLGVLHSWSQTLEHHPHLHCVVPGGGLSPDGTRWVACREDFFLPVKVLSSLFRGKFLALLDEAARRGELRFGGSTAAYADPKAWAAFLGRMRRKPWVVYAKPPFGSPEQVLKYLARYTHRVAISNQRLVSVTDDHVTFRYRDRKRGNAMRTMTLGGVEFLRRFLLHVLPRGFVRIRHFGLLANRTRKAKLAQCRALLGAQAPAVVHPPAMDSNSEPDSDTESHDDREDRRCPRCGIGRLRWFRRLSPTVPPPPPRAPRPPPGTS
jgi:hypothetical protein